MPRRNARRVEPAARAAGGGSERREPWRGVDYAVRSIAGGSSGKIYRCPGCDHEIRPGVGHVVAWPAEDPEAGDRRHWHTVCWQARDRRGPTRRWS